MTEAIERPRSLTSIVIERLLEGIIDGSIGLGSHLSENRIAELFGTSKTPVREAFAHLQTLGLLEVQAQKGGIVFRPTLEQVRELCEVRLELELIAFRLSMERSRLAFTRALSDIVQKMIEAYDVEHPHAYQRLDNDFHNTFFTHCGNSLLARAYELFNPRICALRTQLSTPQPYLLQRSFEEHKMIRTFVEHGDLQSATLVLKEHINRTRECHSSLLIDRNATALR
jgi:GntR family transcriptional regulator, rspAB operon transcriptional repressor